MKLHVARISLIETSKMSSVSLLLCSLLVLCVAARSAASRPWGLRGVLRPPYLPKDTPTPEAQWIEQRLDHIGSDPGTWQQRYFVNSTWWDKGKGPVFLMLGGEGPANPAWIVADTHIMLNAQKYKAMVFSVEHR